VCVTSSEPQPEGQTTNNTGASPPPSEAKGQQDGDPGAGRGSCESVMQPARKHGQVVGFSNSPDGRNWTVEEVRSMVDCPSSLLHGGVFNHLIKCAHVPTT
jgi:hypothetical protein